MSPSRVSFFLTCSADLLYPSAARACIRVLEALGYAVDFPQRQTCCGQSFINTGKLEEAQKTARHFLDVFETAEMVVGPSSSCIDTVRNRYAGLFEGDPELQCRFAALSARSYEFCEFLYQVAGLKEWPRSSRAGRTTYHSSCRTLRGIGLRGVAETYLTQMLGHDFIPLPDSDVCCGFGGSFSVRLPELSGQLLADKLAAIQATGSRTVTALDLSCLTHLAGGAKKLGYVDLQFVHLAELLAATLEEG
jgi:L-lactate dehydrogenase complex protein LldE